MGSTFDYIPRRLTRAYREAQSNKYFQSWLKMHQAAMDIEFPYEDLPEIRGIMYSKESLAIAEAKLLELYPDLPTALTGDENIGRTMRYVYYVGETFRRALEGTWVALPPTEPNHPDQPPRPMLDVPYREGFLNPPEMVQMAIAQRTGGVITRIFGFQVEDYNEWVESGRPERTYRGTLREADE